MATLTETSTTGRRVVLAILAVAVVILGGDFLIKLANQVVTLSQPRVDPWQEATELFGSIPAPKINSESLSPENPQIEFAIDGQLIGGEDAPSSALVYRQPRPQIVLNTTDNAKRIATALGFVGEPQTTQPATQTVKMVWKNSSNTRTLEYQISPEREYWQLRTQYFFDPVAQAAKTVTPQDTLYAQRASGLLGTLGLGQDSLRDGHTQVIFALLGVDGFFTQPLNPSNADYVDVQIYHQLPIALPKSRGQVPLAQQEDLPDAITGKIYRQDPRQGAVSIVASNDMSDISRDVFSLDINKFTYSTDDSSTYPIVSPQEAWERVRGGEGALTQIQLETDDHFARNRTLKIKRFTAIAAETELAFFESNTWNGFITPIYVFKGRGETEDNRQAKFIMYVDAIERL